MIEPMITLPASAPAKAERRPLDWAAIRRHMEAAYSASMRAADADAEQCRRILEARARELARKPDSTAPAGETIEVVEFLLAREHYAIECRFVRDVRALGQVTPVPCTPPFVLGIVNLRGEILSVVDIKKFFDLPDKGLTDLNRLIVLDSGTMRFGILADAINGVRHVPVSDIQTSLPTLTGIRADYLRGLTPGRTVILDAGRLLADEHIVVHEQTGG